MWPSVLHLYNHNGFQSGMTEWRQALYIDFAFRTLFPVTMSLLVSTSCHAKQSSLPWDHDSWDRNFLYWNNATMMHPDDLTLTAILDPDSKNFSKSSRRTIRSEHDSNQVSASGVHDCNQESVVITFTISAAASINQSFAHQSIVSIWIHNLTTI